MKTTTISMSEDLQTALEAYLHDQQVPLTLTDVAQGALREYLTKRGYLPPDRALRITPAQKGSGSGDVSLNHDRYLAER